ncbi:MAG: DUF5362 family protein [Cyclobacteriaceae bacterium]
MEENQMLDRDMNTDLGLTPSAKSYLMETAKWAKFLSIVGFIMIGILVIFAFVFGTVMSNMPEFDEIPGFAGIGGTFITVIYLIMALLYFFPTLYLFRFATKTKAALEGSNTDGLSGGLENLKSTFKFMGILMAIVLGFYALAFIFGIIGGIAGMAM